MYKLTQNSILRLSDSASIPIDPVNTDYANYLTWLSEGNTPEPADIPTPPTYKDLRAAAYPSIADQLDAIWKGGEAEAVMLKQVMAVKSEYPKA